MLALRAIHAAIFKARPGAVMQPISRHTQDAIVQIVGPADGWVLERLARRLTAKLPYAVFVPWRPQIGGAARLIYYVNYALYEHPSGLIDVGFFTHLDETHGFLEKARQLDYAVCMPRLYADWLTSKGVTTNCHIPMGFD